MFPDTQILAFYQSLTEELQVRTGKNCYHVAYILTHVSVILLMVVVARLISQYETPLIAWNEHWSFMILSLAIMAGEYLELSKLKQKSERDAAHPDASELIFGYKFVAFSRLFLLIAAIFVAVRGDYLLGLLVFCWASLRYLKACKPLPPGSKKFLRFGKTARA